MAEMTTKNIHKLYVEAVYWHGTGRYKYDDTGDIVDVLKSMIAEGGLIPHDDDWDRSRGKIKSVSLARSRMYARLYAGMYMPYGKRIENEYAPRWVWFHYFFNTGRVIALIVYIFPSRIVLDYERKLAAWARKITTEPSKILRRVFENGTDIVQNYPMLIGIKSHAVKPDLGSWVFNLHETRSQSSIGFNDMTHIEVPRAQVAETAALLRNASIDTPVIPIEEGESYCRHFSFFELVGGRPLCRVSTRPTRFKLAESPNTRSPENTQ